MMFLVEPELDLAGATTHRSLQEMIPEVPISVRIALFQVLVVIVGVFMTRVAFMMSGYPESNLDWNGLALLVRNYGFTLLLIPVAWTIAVTYLENYCGGWWSRRWTLTTGILILAVLATLLLWSYSNPYNFRKMPMRTLSQ
jgi:magnesium-transporting ATPase (P-type)